jgi:hypothetical protein
VQLEIATEDHNAQEQAKEQRLEYAQNDPLATFGINLEDL